MVRWVYRSGDDAAVRVEDTKWLKSGVVLECHEKFDLLLW